MIGVIFKIEPTKGHKREYLDIAAEIRLLLDEIDGLVWVERFPNLTGPRKILSLSFFEDEAAIGRRRNLSAHRRKEVAASLTTSGFELQASYGTTARWIVHRRRLTAGRRTQHEVFGHPANGTAAAGSSRAALGVVLPLH